ncbi:uncharacterized protein LOC123300174 [Chrysoperla carnea]|uniref:uncharacterized protein LOC123300174 n=1 Tax=Chrysoperla carnea TaxID=189513 RepID=UPI001D097440|nr:uncharacterized protein LOC123300174 [Chrysoperla carnea]
MQLFFGKMKYSIFLIIVIITVSYNSAATNAEDDFCNFGGLKIKLNEWEPMPVGQCMKCKCERTKPDGVSCLSCPEGKILPEDKERCHFTDEDNSLQYPACCPKVVCK